MKKIILLVAINLALFSSCTHIIICNNNYEVVEYNNYLTCGDKKYVKYLPPKYFYPYLSDSSDDRDEYTIDKNYIADIRDENLCFIYNDGGILGNWIYKRTDMEIPSVINQIDKVDCIKISTATGDYYVSEQEHIEVLLNFFSSKEIVKFCKNEYSGSIPKENISFYAVSNYYGGTFSLERGAVVAFGDKKNIMNDEREIDLPLAVIDIVLETLKTNENGTNQGRQSGDGSVIEP